MEWTPVRIPKELFNQIEDLIKKVPYWASENEFVRDAVREKLERSITESQIEPKKEA